MLMIIIIIINSNDDTKQVVWTLQTNKQNKISINNQPNNKQLQRKKNKTNNLTSSYSLQES